VGWVFKKTIWIKAELILKLLLFFLILIKKELLLVKYLINILKYINNYNYTKRKTAFTLRPEINYMKVFSFQKYA